MCISFCTASIMRLEAGQHRNVSSKLRRICQYLSIFHRIYMILAIIFLVFYSVLGLFNLYDERRKDGPDIYDQTIHSIIKHTSKSRACSFITLLVVRLTLSRSQSHIAYNICASILQGYITGTDVYELRHGIPSKQSTRARRQSGGLSP